MAKKKDPAAAPAAAKRETAAAAGEPLSNLAVTAAAVQNVPPSVEQYFADLGDEAKAMAELTFERLKARAIALAAGSKELLPDEEQTFFLRDAAWKATAAQILTLTAKTPEDLDNVRQLKADAASLVCDVGACKAHDGEVLLKRALQETWSDVMDLAFGIGKKLLVVALA